MKKQTKYSILVIIIAALVLELATVQQFLSTRRVFTEQLLEKAQRDLNGSPRIAKVKQGVEDVLDNAMPEVERLVNKPDSLMKVISRLCKDKHQCVGIAIGFMPDRMPKVYQNEEEFLDDDRYGLFAYEEEEKEGSPVYEVVMEFDYTKRKWYTQIVDGDENAQKGSWTEPYIGNLNSLLMSSYSKPVRDASGKTIGVICADVPLRELSQMAAQLYDNQEKALWKESLFHILGLFILGFIVYKTIGSMKRLQVVSLEKERIAGELAVAKNIQRSMLPTQFPGRPERDDLEVYASLEPAREVGGDFYDFLIRKGRLYFCIGDVSGKGVPAALLMSVTRSHFRAEAGRNDSPTAIVTAMNQMLCNEQNTGYFVTMFVGALDLATGELDYCNAGHEPPCLKEKTTGATTVLEVLPNLPIGSLADWDFVGQAAMLKPDTMMFLYTDGVSEAMDANGQLFSREKVMELIRDTEDITPKNIIGVMAEAVKSHEQGCERFDDVTMFALHWVGTSSDFKQQIKIGEKMDLCFTAKLDELLRLKSYVDSLSDKFGIDETKSLQVRLVLEEAVSNVINYSEADAVDIHSCTDEQGVLVITIKDNGNPFDPTQVPSADAEMPLEDRPLGGWGIELMRQMSDGLEYRREDGYNILTIREIIK